MEAAARCGVLDAAAEAARKLSEIALPSGTEWALGMNARCLALIAPEADAEALYQEALDHLKRSRALPELARAHLLYGEWLRRSRRRRDARRELRTAHDMFAKSGAEAFRERAEAELVATGEHIRPRTAETRDLLTPHELRIARMASRGSTNSEIGATLFLSPRTVEYHLHKVYGKLGISSRTMLADVLEQPKSD